MSARYVVLVTEPVPEDVSGAVALLSESFGLAPERAARLLSKAPGPLTRPVAERDARNVAAVLHAGGLAVEVREGSADGPVMEWILPDLSDRPRGAAPYGRSDEAAFKTQVDVPAYTDPSPAGPSPVEPPPAEPARRPAPAHAPAPGRRSAEPDPRKTYVPGSTVTTPPRDPMKTTLERDPPKLERGGLRRRVATAATLPAFLTLLVTLVALAVTLLPLLRSSEERRVASAVNAVAATVEGLSGGLPLSAPLVRAQVARLAERTALRLPAEGVDFLVVLDAERAPIVAWYRGRVGLEELPPALLAGLEERVRDPAAVPPAGGFADSLRRTGEDLLALVGLRDEEPAVAVAAVRRAGADEGLVLAGSEGHMLRSDIGWALLTALLVGLVPVLFGVLAALSLSRGLRDAITYLLRATDRISHGDLERPVELKRDDELGQIARAVERMRVSLLEAMERLRRR